MAPVPLQFGMETRVLPCRYGYKQNNFKNSGSVERLAK